MLDISGILPLLQDFCQKDPRILVVYLFGSYNDGSANIQSDLDLAVLFKEDIDLRTEMALQVELSTIIGFEDIDLLDLNKAPLLMQFKVISNGRLIYEADADLSSDFLENVLLRYHDQEFRYQRFFQDWDEGLREDYRIGQS
jgi:predicted nucleotidyltransferase